MSDSIVSGACLCSAVRFRIRLPSIVCGHCHCSICRRSHGAGFVTWLVVPRNHLLRDQGFEYLVRYASSNHTERSFCGRCGSSLFCESTQRPDQVDIALANVREKIDRQPEAHVHFDDRAQWVRVDDGLPRLGGPSGLEPIHEDPAIGDPDS